MKGRGIVSNSWLRKLRRLLLLMLPTFLASSVIVAYFPKRQMGFNIFSFELHPKVPTVLAETKRMHVDETFRWKVSENVPSARSKTVTREEVTLNNTTSDKLIQDYHFKSFKLRRAFTCSKLFDGDVTEVERVTSYLNKYRKKIAFRVIPTDAEKISRNCKAFASIRQYRQKASSAVEENFPLAYVIVMHKSFEQLERLVRALYQPQNVFCIHVDLKSPDSLYQTVQAYASCFPNVHLASSRYNVTYAHVTRLLADIQCMKDLARLKHPWRYLMTTVSTEFPLRTNKEKVDIFTMMNGTNCIRETWSTRSEIRFRMSYRVVKGRMKKTNLEKSPPPHNITIVKGRAGNVFSRAFVNWFHQDKMAQDLLQWSRDTYSPDEHYWATLNDLYHNPFLKTPGGYQGHPDTKNYFVTFAVWTSNKNPNLPCHSTSRHNICIFGVSDLPLVGRQVFLWANKFDIDLDPVSYTCMEELLDYRETNPRQIDLLPYRQIWPKTRTDATRKEEKGSKAFTLSNGGERRFLKPLSPKTTTANKQKTKQE